MRVNPILSRIEEYKKTMSLLSDDGLKNMTTVLKKSLKRKTPDDILPEAFAVAKEACRRVLGKEPYPAQLIGGIYLHKGYIAEMMTGEGKTLAAVLPAYLNALEGKGVHIITVNDYLAKRDADEMGQVFRFLGLTVGVSLSSSTRPMKKEAYACDITYVTNEEAGFDYLRDNMVYTPQDRILRGFHYVIIDEADSILIDEARTPLIIGGRGKRSISLIQNCCLLMHGLTRSTRTEEYTKADMLGGYPVEDGDYILYEKKRAVILTENGLKKAARFLKVDDLNSIDQLEKLQAVNMALKAHFVMKNEEDYVVKDGQVQIINEFTGRILPGQRFQDGLHQALEAKEGVTIKDENRTIAAVTYQSFFNLYEKKAGMTGTAYSDKKELWMTYHLRVRQIPTNRPVIRIDHPDVLFETIPDKYHAVVTETVKTHETGQPVLIGTSTIEASNEISKLLTKAHINHHLLSATQNKNEAEVVANAGLKGAVTVATNMAGRGTDIKLGEGVAELGGLKIIGTERHESRRIDDQLKGRAGRQGDPGESVFFLSAEDKMMRIYGRKKFADRIKVLSAAREKSLNSSFLSRLFRKAQKEAEASNYSIRKSVFDFDRIENIQRLHLYDLRNQVIDMSPEQIHSLYLDFILEIVTKVRLRSRNKEEYLSVLSSIFNAMVPDIRFKDKVIYLSKLLEQKEKEFPDKKTAYEMERKLLLFMIDEKWIDHMEMLDSLKTGIYLTSYAGHDPVSEYRNISFDEFEEMLHIIKEKSVYLMMMAKA